MITAFTVKNFKAIGDDKVKIELKPITLLFGANSAGKSSILHALNYAYSVFCDHNLNAEYNTHHDSNFNLGGFSRFVHDNDLKRCVRYYSSRTFRRSWMRLGFMPAHPSFYCRKIIYDKYGGFDLSYKIASDFECLLRFIFVHKIQTTYIPMDFVTMRTGGTSTSGFASHKQIISDHQKAFKRNGIYSNAFLESLRYIYKIHEVLLTKITR